MNETLQHHDERFQENYDDIGELENCMMDKNANFTLPCFHDHSCTSIGDWFVLHHLATKSNLEDLKTELIEHISAAWWLADA